MKHREPRIEGSFLQNLLVIGGILLLVLSRTSADVSGVEYVPSSDTFIYGGSSFYARSRRDEDEIHTLYLRQPGANVDDILFRSEGALSNIKASSHGEFIAVLDLSSRENVSREESNYVSRQYGLDGLVEIYYDIQSILRILNLQGDLLASISDVQRYTWDPSGRRIAYLTGTEYEGGFGFLSTGAWIHDVSTERAEQIHSGGYDIQWANWDGNIYIYDPFNETFPETRVFQFDIDTEELVTSSHQGVYFSPEGRYYFAQGYEGSSLKVFETETEDEVSVDLTIHSPDRTLEAFSAAGWLDENILIVHSPIPNDRGDYLYGIDARTMWQADGRIVPVSRSDGRALVIEGMTVVERSIEEFDSVLPPLPTAMSFGMAIEDGALIGLRVTEIEDTSPPFQVGLRVDDILLLPGGPISANSVSRLGTDAIRALFPGDRPQFRWLVRSPNGDVREVLFEFAEVASDLSPDTQ